MVAPAARADRIEFRRNGFGRSRRIRRRALVVLLTDLNSSAPEEGLLQVLPQLAARHQVIIAAVSDPRVEEMSAGRSDAATVWSRGRRTGPQRP